MRHRLPHVHPRNVVAIGRIHAVEALVHRLLGAESLDNPQSAERFLHLTHRVAPQRLRLHRLRLQLLANQAHKPAENRHENDGEQRELPRNDEQRGEIDHNQNRILKQHVERRHNRIFDFLHIAAHACNDVALALLREETERQRRDFLVELVADVAHHARANRHNRRRRQEVSPRFQERQHRQHNSDDEQRRRRARRLDEPVHVVVHVVHRHRFNVLPVPRHQLSGFHRVVRLKQNAKHRHERHKRKHVENGRQDVEHHRQNQIFLVRRHKSPQHLQKVFHTICKGKRQESDVLAFFP